MPSPVSSLQSLVCALAVLALAAPPASALTCLPWAPANAYQEAAGAQDVFNVLAGTLQFDGSLLPQSHAEDPNDTPPLTKIPAQLTGHMLMQDGFTKPVEVAVELEVECLGPWCTSPPPGQNYLVFARQQGPRLIVRAGVCGGFLFDDIPEVRQEVLDCLQGKACVPARLD